MSHRSTTDLLILMCYYTEMGAEELFFQPEPRGNSTKRRVWNMKVLKEKLGQDVCNNISFIRAILGCDTTYRLHGLERGPFWRNSVWAITFEIKLKCSTTHLHQRRKLLKLVRRLWFAFAMVNLAEPWIVLDTVASQSRI